MRRFAWTVPLFLVALIVFGDQPSTRAAGSLWHPEDGPLAIDSTIVTLHDAGRNKDLGLQLFYPKGDGPFPVIVFSHGAGSVGDAYRILAEHWASYGYVCILPTHADSLVLDKDPNAMRDWEQHMPRVVGAVLKDSDGWANRARNITFILDSLDEIQKQVPAIKGKLDPERIGVGGHSYGALTAMLVGGVTIDLPDKPAASFADPRVRCILILSPQGRGQMGLTDHSWDKLKLPMLAETGTFDFGASGQGPQWRSEPFRFAPAGDKYLVFIEGANHFSMTGKLMAAAPTRPLSPAPPDPKAIQQYLKSSTLAFWDAYLRQDDKAKGWLQSDELENYSAGGLRMWRK